MSWVGAGRKFWSCLAVLAGVAALAGADWTAKQPPESEADTASAPAITVSEETTRITAPLTEDGYVDYQAALNASCSAGVTPENNAAVLYLEVLGPNELPFEWSEEIYAALGIDPLPEDGEYLESLGEYVERIAGDDEAFTQRLTSDYYQALQQPWTSADFPEYADWMETNSELLDLVVKATRLERCYWPQLPPTAGGGPLDFGGGELVDGMSNLKLYLLMRSMWFAGQGDLDAAFEQILAIRRMGNQWQQLPWTFAVVLCRQHQSYAVAADTQLQLAPEFSQKAVQNFLVRFGELPPPRPYWQYIDEAERYRLLDHIQWLSRGHDEYLRGMENVRYDHFRVNRVLRLVAEEEVDWDEVMRTVNYWYDRFVEAAKVEPYSARRKALDEVNKAYEEFVEYYPPTGEVELPPEVIHEAIAAQLMALSFGNLHARSQEEVAITAQERMIQACYALEAYQREHGRYPAGLDALCPDFFPSPPLDPFSDDNDVVRYERAGPQYYLYCVGRNGIDDGAQNDGVTTDDVLLGD